MKDWLEDFKVLFKKMTGLDYDNHKPEEYNEWYHNKIIEASQSDSYTKEIVKMAEDIIKNNNYPTLVSILENYDSLVKEKFGYDQPGDYPYWCYGFGYNMDTAKPN